jgi:hypothetical protein
MKLATFFSLLAILACVPIDASKASAGGTTTPQPAKPYRIVQQGAFGAAASGDVDQESGRRAPFVEIATDAKTYAALWKLHIDGNQPPAIDFAKETVIFLLLPPRATGGYSVKLRDVTLDGPNVKVDADLEEPKKGEIVTQAFTAPYAVIAVAQKNVNEVEWINQGRLLARKSLTDE